MILLDDRTGSIDLLPYLKRLGQKTQVTRLDFGDACFEGSGPGNSTLLIGVERKRIRDMLTSQRSNRLSGFQLPGMLAAYDRSYLVVEGLWRPGEGGELEVWGKGGWRGLEIGRSAFTYRELDNFLNSLENCAGVVVRRTGSPYETAVVLRDLYGWWEKDWKTHKSVTSAYIRKSGVVANGLIHKFPGIVWRIASQFPGVDSRGEEIEKEYKRPREFLRFLADAGVKELEKLPGVGKETARKMVAELDDLGGTRAYRRG